MIFQWMEVCWSGWAHITNILYQVCVFRTDGSLAETFFTPPLKLSNGIHRNLTWSKISTSSPKFVFFSQSEKQDGHPGLWLAEPFWLLLWNRWMEFIETWHEAGTQRPLPSVSFSGRLEKQDGHAGLWFAKTFSTSPLKPLNEIQQNLTGSKILMSFTKFVFFWPIG